VISVVKEKFQSLCGAELLLLSCWRPGMMR